MNYLQMFGSQFCLFVCLFVVSHLLGGARAARIECSLKTLSISAAQHSDFQENEYDVCVCIPQVLSVLLEQKMARVILFLF